MKFLLLFALLKANLSRLPSIVFILVSLLSTSISASESNKQLSFKRFSTADGLSQSYVFSIAQDNQGFIWFATEDGLNRYDGFDFVHYRNDIHNRFSLANNFVRTLYIDKSGVLWVGTANGLSRYNREQDNFTNFFSLENDKSSLKDNTIWTIYEGKNKNGATELLVATESGLHRFNPTSENFTRIVIDDIQNALVEIKTVFQDNNNDYWFGTFSNGIYIANQSLSRGKRLNANGNASAKWGFAVDATGMFDFKVIDENYWLATNNGLYIFTPKQELIAHQTFESTQGKLLSDTIRTVTEYDEHTVVLGTSNGLVSIDRYTFEANTIEIQTNSLPVSSEAWVMSTLKSVSGHLWLGTYGEGIYNNHPNYNLIKSELNHLVGDQNSISEVIELVNGNIWLLNEEGDVYEKAPNKKEAYKLELGIEVNQLLSIENGSKVLIYSDDGRLYETSVNSSITSFITSWDNKHLPPNNAISYFDHKICFINEKGWLTCIDLKGGSNTQAIPEGEESLSAITVQEDGSLLLITESKNIYQYQENADKFTFVLSLSSIGRGSFIATSIKQSSEYYWLNSGSHGLLAISLDLTKSYLFNENNQLINNYISDVVIDNDGNAWIGSNKGISVIDTSLMTVRRVDSDFNAPNSEFIFGSSLKTREGDIIFGSSNGYFKLSPESILKTKQSLSAPIITDISIANKSLTSIELEGNPSTIDHINVAYKQFPLKLSFASPLNKFANQTAYRYRLDGLEEEWIETDIYNRSATYTNLSPGDYTFKVEVFDTFNPREKRSTDLKMTILPPWWLGKGAIAVYSLVLSLLLLYFLQQLRHRQRYHSQIKQSEERLKLSLWGSGDEMWDWNIKTKKIFRSNIWGILDFPQDGTRNVGTDQTNIHPNDLDHVKDALNAHFDQETEHFETTYRVKNKNNQWVWVLDRGKVVERGENDQPSRMTGTLKDISHIKKAEERLKLFAKCIENISDAVVIYDRRFTIVDVNKSFVRITGRSKAEMLGKSLKFERYPDTFTQSIKKHLVVNGNWQGEIESKRNNDETYYTDLTLDVIRDGGNNISHFVGVFSDITERKKTDADLRRLANSDTLTGLPNRSFFQANQLKLMKSKVPHALLVFDLDNFKKINDSMGHQVGDSILIEVAKRISKIASKRTSVYRLGGDEFSVIIENTNDIHTITSLAKSILKLIALPLKVKNQELVLFSSIGIVLNPEDGATPQELLKNADTAMYHAKNNGGNRYQFFSDSMNKEAVQRIQVETLIRHGLKDGLFSVFYQPKIDIATGKIAGMEALVRFETPTKGVISPLVFIPVSEETGQIIDIGEVVLRKSCYAAKRWVDAGLFDGRVAVNLSAVQFTQPNLVKTISAILQESQLPAKYLELEITEGTVMDSPQEAIDTMLQIRAMGIHLSLDDFGTGYSSLAYLKKFPLNTLKIDKAFVDDIEVSEQGRNMVATIVTIAHNLGMQVVAEGVENNNQLNFLSGLGCEQLQGYLYSKPLPEPEFQKYLLSYQITDNSTSKLQS
ncbi:MAG: EAL domain-containing protein [Thalassotalea sp.]|nr:EAL domain-containing protein [Thalassotalea sp.]